MFADDLKYVYYFKRTINSGIEANINRDISNTSNFLKIWLLQPPLNKCAYLQIDLNLSLNIDIDGHCLWLKSSFSKLNVSSLPMSFHPSKETRYSKYIRAFFTILTATLLPTPSVFFFRLYCHTLLPLWVIEHDFPRLNYLSKYQLFGFLFILVLNQCHKLFYLFLVYH